MKYVFFQMWQNKAARYMIFGLFALVTALYFYRIRYNVYNFFYYFSVGSIFDDPTTWSEGEYGFQENLSMSKKFYEEGLEELIEKAGEIYSKEIQGSVLVSKISPNVSWQNHVKRSYLEATLTLLKEIKLFCRQARVEDSAYAEWSRKKRLEKRKPKENRKVKKAFVINEKKVNELRKWIMALDKRSFYTAMQKKPDHYAVITLREDILQSSCQPLHSVALWHKALDYLEYTAEKKNYKKGIDPDLLKLKVKQSLQNHRNYNKFLNEFFRRSFHTSSNVDWKIKQSWKNFVIHRDVKSLNEYCEIMLEKCRLSGISNCKLIYDSLYKLKHRKINSNPVYLYAMAETAFRIQKYESAKRFLKQILLARNIDPLQQKRAQRLMNTILLLRKIGK